MTTRRSRSTAYRFARFLGDVQATEHGPASFVKRRARRVVYRHTNRWVTRFLRKAGLL